MCRRDGTCTIVLAKIEWFSPMCDVHISEALALLSTLGWIHKLQSND